MTQNGSILGHASRIDTSALKPDVNGEAIYGTTTWKHQAQWSEGEQPTFQYSHYREKYDIMELTGAEPKDGKAVKRVFFTKKGAALYAVTPFWPQLELSLKDLTASEDTVVTMLGVEGQLGWRKTEDRIAIRPPALSVDEIPSRFAHTFKITGVE